MKVAIMQPYFLPYIGYWQLISAVDEFVVYDNIKYTKKGWFNRNRFLLNNKDEIFTIPLKSASDNLDVIEKEISPSFSRQDLLRRFEGAYRKAPYYNVTLPLLKRIVEFSDNNLFRYNLNSIKEICNFLKIKTKITVSSEINIDHSLRSQDKVIAICKILNATSYINPMGGIELYEREDFSKHGLSLSFLKPDNITYSQFCQTEFVGSLSILDVLMFNGDEKSSTMLERYSLT